MAAATADWSAVMQRHEAVLLEAISCIDNQIPRGSQVSINVITGRRKCICTLHCKCGPTLYEQIWTEWIREVCKHPVLLYKEMQPVSPTCPVFVPGVAGERLQAKTVERHVRTQAREIAGMRLLSQLLCRCAAACPRKRSGQENVWRKTQTWVSKTKHSFFVVFTNDSDGRIIKLVFPHNLLIFESRNIACNVFTPWSQGG